MEWFQGVGFYILRVKLHLLSCFPRPPDHCESGGFGRCAEPSCLRAEVPALAGSGLRVAKCTAALAWLEEGQRLSGF